MDIKLTFAELKVLGEVLSKSESIRRGKDFYHLQMSAEAADEFRDLLQAELEQNELDLNYSPTPRGTVLESLVDKFFTG